jgi:hypothetical protein
MMKIIKGDSIVLMTKKQADDINIIFAKQKSKIQKLQDELEIAIYKKDSIQWLMFDQDNWIDYAILQMREDSISNVSNLEMANRVRDLRAAVVSFDKTKGQYNVFPMGNYDTVTNKNGEMNLKPKRYAEKSDWYALLFTVLTVTNLMVFLN